ncbi:hypothetical protein [Caulobacter segnis]|uniref:Uncharacterized protein n=1 Tax=Caulobacter segnis TaxID=88688 RepID=A0A2W5XFJ1_9CAUL|nr:hypothetical protein [Caulobacter segnis]PZR36461.1 MAG: hypothetical protein DI526_03215 [Caulobacter segnis]
MQLSEALIRCMSPIAQAKAWAHLEDELLLDLDMIDGVTLETEPLRIATANRLAERGVVHAVAGSTGCVRVTRVFPLRKVA